MFAEEGRRLHNYLLLKQLSKSGIAEVYLAHRPEEKEHEVIVKLFRSSYAQQAAFREYFLLEAERIAQFAHPHLLPLLDYGEESDGVYVVYPFVPTGTLEDLQRRIGGRFSALQAVPVVQQVSSAMTYIHAHHLVHSNIKPSNIFLASDGRLLLADFGIVRGYDDSQQSLTRIGWGSAAYAAPEQSLGVSRPASDIYALGVLLFALLTGSPPFTGQTPVEVLLKHVRQTAPSMRERVPSISDAVDAVILKALQKRPDDRFASAEAFCQAFERAVAVAPIASPLARPRPLLRSQPGPSKPVHADQAIDPATPVPPTLFAAEDLIVQEAEVHISALQEQMGAVSSLDTTGKRTRHLLQEELCDSIIARPQKLVGQEDILSEDPPEWSPLAQAPLPDQAQAIPLTATAYLRRTPLVPLEEATPDSQLSSQEQTDDKKTMTRSNQLRAWLPLIIVLLLLVGLLAALCSAFFFPAG